jgi:predicted transcriptional regulator
MAKNTVNWKHDLKGTRSDVRESFSQEQVAEALTAAGGVQADAARILGCSRTTINGYVRRYPHLQELIIQTREETLDLAESQLIKKVKDGNMTAIIFYLKTQGKQRGYVEKGEAPQKQEDSQDFSTLSTEELEALGRELSGSVDPAKPPRLDS